MKENKMIKDLRDDKIAIIISCNEEQLELEKVLGIECDGDPYEEIFITSDNKGGFKFNSHDNYVEMIVQAEDFLEEVNKDNQ